MTFLCHIRRMAKEKTIIFRFKPFIFLLVTVILVLNLDY